MKVKHGVRLAAWAMVFSMACSEKTPDPLITVVPNIPAPFNLSVTLGASLSLTWEFDSETTYDEFVIYRAENAGALVKTGSAQVPPYVDSTIRAGNVYDYQVAGVSDGVEGKRSTTLTVVASFFAVTINAGDVFTNSRDVQLAFSAPGSTQLVRYAESANLDNEPWVSYTATQIFMLSAGDGAKTVYTQFTDQLGHETEVFSDDITLDTVAEIESATIPTAMPVSPGATLHFVVTPVGNELEGSATIDIENFGTPIVVRDDGELGDPAADDGIYQRDWVSPVSFRGTDLKIRAVFTDAAGNSSAGVELGEVLTFMDPPSAVFLQPATDSTITTISLRWTKSEDQNFANYEIFRDVTSGVSRETSTKVTDLFSADQVTHEDGGLEEGKQYFYVVYVVNDLNEVAGSNVRAASTDDVPPTAVVVDSISSIDTNRLTLTWSRNEDSDFAEYRIYRKTSPGVTEIPIDLVATITDRFVTFLDDTGLDTVANTYYYRVFVVDNGGNSTRSNEMASKP